MAATRLYFDRGFPSDPAWIPTSDGDEVPNEELRRECINVDHHHQRLDTELSIANHDIMCDIEHLSQVPHIYLELFQRTKNFTASVRDLVHATAAQGSTKWADAARLLVDWSVNILRHERIGFERFLHSQRQSLYWILDDALLRICLDQWDDTSSSTPWDQTTAPIGLALSKAQEKLPDWGSMDLEELRIREMGDGRPAPALPRRGALEGGYFERSQCFLQLSTRVYELWRTVKMCGKGQLPAELANAIVEDVSRFEELPTGNLRCLFFPKRKGQLWWRHQYRLGEGLSHVST